MCTGKDVEHEDRSQCAGSSIQVGLVAEMTNIPLRVSESLDRSFLGKRHDGIWVHAKIKALCSTATMN